MSHIQGIERSQSVLFPEVVDDFIDAENPVRFIDAYVDSLPLGELGFTHAQTAETGRPPYAPGDMLKLYVYGYINHVRSSRQLEQLTHRNVEVFWLLRRLQPDFKTIADFRKDNLKALKQVCREFTLLCKKLNLFGGELVAIDGSKFSAVNHTNRVYTKEKLQRLLAEIDEKVHSFLTQLDTEDAAVDETAADSRKNLREHIAHLREHKAELVAIQTRMEHDGLTQITTTDPDSRLMQTGNHGKDVCYNAQIAVDDKHKLIVAHELTNDVNDLHQIAPMAQQAKAVLGVETLDVTADKGYYNETQIRECEQEQIHCYIPEPQKSQNNALGLYTDKDFVYDAATDQYRCPANEYLTYRGTYMKRNKHVRQYATRACKHCVLRSQCTRSHRDGRRIGRWVYEKVIETMLERLRTNPEKARRRAEHPFGTLKRIFDHGYFLMRGKLKVATEFSMSVLAYNMKRVLAILGVPKLLRILGNGRAYGAHGRICAPWMLILELWAAQHGKKRGQLAYAP